MPVNGIRIHAATETGPPILLFTVGRAWRNRHHVMPLLAEHFSVVAIDLRGAAFGAAMTAMTRRRWRATRTSNVAAGIIAIYVACDIGGMVALPLTLSIEVGYSPCCPRCSASWLEPVGRRRRQRSDTSRSMLIGICRNA